MCGAGDITNVHGLVRPQVAKVEADARSCRDDLEQRRTRALECDGRGHLTRRQVATASTDEAIDDPDAVCAAMAVMDVRGRNAGIPGRAAASPLGDFAAKIARDRCVRPQLVPDREVIGLAERASALGIADDREPAEVDAVGGAIDLDEPMLTAATGADHPHERRTASLPLALLAVHAAGHPILVSRFVTRGEGSRCPLDRAQCIAGARACQPVDCFGIWSRRSPE